MLGIQFRLLRYRLIFRIRRRRSDQDRQIINDCLSVSSLPCAFLYFRSPLLFVGGKLLLTISGLHIVGRKGGGGQMPPPGKLNFFFNIVFEFVGLFLEAILVRNLKKTD